MKIKYVLGSAFLILLIGMMAIPTVNGEVKTKVVEVDAGDTHYFTIQAGSGNLEISWEITDWNDDNLVFQLFDPSGGYIAQTTNTRSYSDTIYVDAGYYRFEWSNNNIFEGYTLSYTIIYQSYSEEIEEEGGVCGSVLAISVIGMIGLIFVIGYIVKRK